MLYVGGCSEVLREFRDDHQMLKFPVAAVTSVE